MKTKIIYSMFFMITLLMSSCNYETNIRDAEYPDQVLYMPSAKPDEGFIIDDITRVIGELPFEGTIYRYEIDTAKNEFSIPLSVYRGGVNNKEDVRVNIVANTDTITVINDSDKLGYTLVHLPAENYTLTDKTVIKDGDEISIFKLQIDLNFLRNSESPTKYGIGVTISSQDREINQELAIAVVIINTRIFHPVADCSYTVDNKKLFVENTSEYAEKYVWNFGDGSPLVPEPSTEHVYTSSGSYLVKLTAIGITGTIDQSVITKEIVSLISSTNLLFLDFRGITHKNKFNNQMRRTPPHYIYAESQNGNN